MSRILFILFIVFLVWLLFRTVRTRRPGDRATDAATDAAGKAREAEPRRVETISQCAWCGVHVPPQEAVALPDGRIYCCDPHRDAARQAVAPVDRRPS